MLSISDAPIGEPKTSLMLLPPSLFGVVSATRFRTPLEKG